MLEIEVGNRDKASMKRKRAMLDAISMTYEHLCLSRCMCLFGIDSSFNSTHTIVQISYLQGQLLQDPYNPAK